MSDSIFRIWSIALYEAKVIMRGWTFRIALLVNIAVLIVLYFIRSFSFKFFYAGLFEIPSSFPYLSFLVSGCLMALTGAFIATESYSRLRTLDSNEAVLSRDFCLLEFAAGRSVALLWAFIVHSGVVWAITLAYNLGFAKAETTFLPYLLYPALIALPSFVFITGFAMFIQAVGRNKALTITIVLGSVVFFILYTSDRFYYTFDVLAVKMPMLLSLIAGLDGALVTFMQRGAWTLAGLSMSITAFLMLRRPKQSKPLSALMKVLAPVFIAITLFTLFSYVKVFSCGTELRAEMIRVADEYRNEPLAIPESFHIDLTHDDNEIEVITTIALRNDQSEVVEKYILNVNPGLRVLSVESSGRSLDFIRKQQIIDIDPLSRLEKGERDTIMITCRGTIDDRACFPDADESVRWRGFSVYEDYYAGMELFKFRYSHFRFRRRYSWTGRDYMLLTPYSMWYPAPGVMRGSQDPGFEHLFFAEYIIDVLTDERLNAVSQGPAEKTGPGRFRFVPGEKLPGLTLAVGQYTNRAIEVDGVEYSLSTLSSDSYFMPYAEELADTLPALLSDVKNWIELEIGIDYPLGRMALVEVPAGFHSMPRPMVTNGKSCSQPGLILAPERGYRWDTTLFDRRRQDRRASRQEKMSPLESKASDFINMIRHTILLDVTYCPISSWYSGVIHIHSEDCPLFDHAFESYFAEKMNWTIDMYDMFKPGTGRVARTILSLEGTSLEGLVSDLSRREEAIDVLPIKGKQLFLEMESFVGRKELENFLADFIWENRWRKVSVEEFYSAFEEISGVDIQPIVEVWYKGRDLPGFTVESPSWYGFKVDKGERCQVKLKAYNRGEVAGLIGVDVHPEFSRGGRGAETERRVFRFEPGEARELGIVTDFRPRKIQFNTLISRNLPVYYQVQLKGEEYPYIDDPEILDGSRPIDPSRFKEPEEAIVVDNTDPGFEIVSDPERSLLSRMIGSGWRSSPDSRYAKLIPREPPVVWREIVMDICYGRYIRSGYLVAAGTGTGRVRWTVDIPESGTYEVYHHMVDRYHAMKPKHRKNMCIQEHHFSISHDEGIDEQILVLHECPLGWNLLGTYYFSMGKATVELTDESPKWFIIADAVKWVKKD